MCIIFMVLKGCASMRAAGEKNDLSHIFQHRFSSLGNMVFERFKKGDASMRAAGEKNGFNSRKYVISNIDFPLRLNTPP